MIINLSRIDFGGVATGGGGNAKPEEVFDVQPTTSDQTITPTEGSVFSGGTVRAVTSEIDVNITSNNIKEGVSILGVAGTLKEEKSEETFNVQPTTAEQTITPSVGSVFSGGTVHAVTSSIDSNIVPENIKEGVSILGVAGTLSGGSGGDTPDYRYMKGTVDKAGLKAIGWTDEDILTYEQNKTPHYTWQNDQFIVSDENKALYLLDDPNPSSYRDNPNIEYIPKKNMESYFAKSSAFVKMKYIKGIPFYNTSNVTNATRMFASCSSLTTVPPLNISSATNVSRMFAECSSLTSIPPIDTSKATNVSQMFSGCSKLIYIPQLNLSQATDVSYLFENCSSLITIPPIDTSKATNVSQMFSGCDSLTTVEGVDFSGLTKNITNLFGYSSTRIITRFIVNGKINVSISDNYSIKALTAIDYDSVKSILAAADRTDNTNAKTLAFNRTMTDQNGELAALVASCTSKGWTITGLTLN